MNLYETDKDVLKSIITNERYLYISSIIKAVYKKAHKGKLSTSDKIDKIRETIKLVVKNKFVHYASFDQVQMKWTDGYHLTQESSDKMVNNLDYVLGVICGVK